MKPTRPNRGGSRTFSRMGRQSPEGADLKEPINVFFNFSKKLKFGLYGAPVDPPLHGM